MPDKNVIPVRTKQQAAKEEVQELRWLRQLNRQTRYNRREAAHEEEKAQLRDALSRSEQSNARQRERNATQRIFERRCRLGASTVRHLVILLGLALVLLNGLADKVICIPAIGVMLFVVGFDMARIWVEFIGWLVSPKKRKHGGN